MSLWCCQGSSRVTSMPFPAARDGCLAGLPGTNAAAEPHEDRNLRMETVRSVRGASPGAVAAVRGWERAGPGAGPRCPEAIRRRLQALGDPSDPPLPRLA